MIDDDAGKKRNGAYGVERNDAIAPQDDTNALGAVGNEPSSVNVLGVCRITIDDMLVEAREGETILQAAKRAGIEIAAMCADPRMKPTGDCELCNVVVSGQEDYVKACMTVASEGMSIQTETSELKG